MHPYLALAILAGVAYLADRLKHGASDEHQEVSGNRPGGAGGGRDREQSDADPHDHLRRMSNGRFKPRADKPPTQEELAQPTAPVETSADVDAVELEHEDTTT